MKLQDCVRDPSCGAFLSSGAVRARYAWVVSDRNGTVHCVNAPDAETRVKLMRGGAQFRTYDGDHNLNHFGVIVWREGVEPYGFEPLDDYLRGAEGETSIEYYNPETKTWEEL